MFCPRCKAEYRTGFTRCSDCGVELLEGAVPHREVWNLIKHGSLLQRTGAYLIDHIVASFAGSLVLGLVFRGLLAAGLYTVTDLILPGIRGPGADLRSLWATYSFLDKVRFMVVLIAMPRWIYMTLFQGSRWQATPGKMLMGLKVVNASGSGIGYKTSAFRSLIRGSLFVFTLGLSGLVNLLLIGRPKRRALHDRIVGSEVISTSWLESDLKIHDGA